VVKQGGWRTLNFRFAPFNFPAPLHLLNERCTENNGKYADKSLVLWKILDIEKICMEKSNRKTADVGTDLNENVKR